MKILIMGAGAIGSVFGGFLSNSQDVTLIGRVSHISAIRKKGLRISGIWGEHLFKNLKAFTSADECREFSPYDLILITTKSYDTEYATKQILPLIKEDSIVVSVQNGIGNEEIISKMVGKERTMGGMAIFGAMLIKPGHVKVTVYASECLFGTLSQDMKRSKAIADITTKAGIPSLPTDDIIREKWMKVFYNIALNPLSAILKVRYGALGIYDETRAIIKSMLQEAFEVAKAEGIRLKFTWEEYFNYLIEKQLPPTAEHISSMLQDLERRKRTEVDYMNGAIVRLGKVHGTKTPVNEAIVNLIKTLERMYGVSNLS
ncbi:MAG: ketopantoate reductase family protein [archaeon]|nr:ketopantoate reductase family protein [archaeon]